MSIITDNKENLEIAFFGRTTNISETFIYNLLVGLNQNCQLTFVNGYNRRANYRGINEITTGIKERSWYLYFIENKYIGLIFRKFTPKLVESLKKKDTFFKLKKVLNKKNFDVAYVDYGMSAVQILPYLESRKIPLVVHFHGYDITSELNNKSYRSNLKDIFNYSSKIIVASHHIKCLAVLEGCPMHKLKVVRYGITIPPNIVSNLWETKFLSNPKILFAGRLVEKKNPLALIHAFVITLQKHPTAKLHIIGDGELLLKCKKRVNDLGLKNNVIFYGALSNHDIFEHLKDTWIYAQHSVTSLTGDQEGFAISPAEAAIMGIPVVSTLHNGIPEHVIHDKTGLLSREFDFETMGENMSFLLANKDVLIRFGNEGKENISKMCNSEKRINQVLDVLVNVKKNE